MVNKVILVGFLGRDPEIRYAGDGKPIASFSVGTTEKWKDKATGERKEATEWHRITAFGALGDICAKWLKKGKQVYIEGKLKTNKWQKDGVDHYTTEIHLNEFGGVMLMLGKKEEHEATQTQAQTPAQARPTTPTNQQPGGAVPSGASYDDPF